MKMHILNCFALLVQCKEIDRFISAEKTTDTLKTKLKATFANTVVAVICHCNPILIYIPDEEQPKLLLHEISEFSFASSQWRN